MSTSTVELAHLSGISEEAIDTILLSRTLSEYAQAVWHVHEPAKPLIWGWHMDAICEHLEAVTLGQITELVINVPPRHAKSNLVSVFWPTWSWQRKPSIQWLFSSYALELSIRDSVACRRIIQAPWYRARWGHVYQLTGDQNAKTRFENDKHGQRLATSVDSAATGWGGDIVCVDDAHNVKEAPSDLKRQAVLTWWDQTMSTRVNDPKTGARVVVGQRVHEDDLSGHVLKQGTYQHLCLPAEYEPGRSSVTVLGNYEKRTHKGELLHPDRFGQADVDALKVKLGPYGVAGQLQQRPSPLSGGLIKRSWFRFWVPPGAELGPVRDKDGNEYPVVEIPEAFDDEIQSWDMSFKDEAGQVRRGKAPDPVSGGTWGRRGPDCYLRDRAFGVMDIVDTMEAVISMTASFPHASAKLVEDKANGPAVMAILRRRIAGFIPVTPQGDKVSRVITAASTDDATDARAMSMQAIFHAGNVYVPHPRIAPWVWDYVENVVSFPTGATDDDVDMTSQALAYLQPGIWRGEDRVTRAALRGELVLPQSTAEIMKQRRAAILERERNPRRRRLWGR